MNKQDQTFLYDVVTDNLALMSKIYQSFEALEETLGALKMEEPLLINHQKFSPGEFSYRGYTVLKSIVCNFFLVALLSRKSG